MRGSAAIWEAQRISPSVSKAMVMTRLGGLLVQFYTMCRTKLQSRACDGVKYCLICRSYCVCVFKTQVPPESGMRRFLTCGQGAAVKHAGWHNFHVMFIGKTILRTKVDPQVMRHFLLRKVAHSAVTEHVASKNAFKGQCMILHQDS